jgi:DNA uptake protein ComE-like DNA-binding protein
MTARIAVGSVSMLAMSAALLVGASLWLHKPSVAAHGTPWGDLSSLANKTPSPQQSDEDAHLLKLAALKSSNAAAEAPVQAVSLAEPVSTTNTETVAATPPDVPVVSQAVAADQPAATPVVQPAAPVQLAETEAPPAAEAPAVDASPAKTAGVNLNTASADALDRIGAGRVGRTIVAHRPYRSVKDLVNKRVLRMSDYQKVEARVRAD